MKIKRVTFVYLFLSVVICGSAFAGSRAECGSPVIVDDATTMARGRWKLTTKATHEAQPGLYETCVSLGLAYGITDHLELGISPKVHKAQYGEEANTNNHGSVHEFGDVKVSLKYHFLEEGDRIPALGTEYALKIPTNTDSKGLTTGEVDNQLVLLASKGIGKAEVDLNVGYKYVGEPDDRIYSNVVSYGAAFQYPVKKVILTTELEGKTDYKQKHLTIKENILDAYLGVKYKVTKDFRLQVALGTRLSEANPDYLGVLKIKYYFGF